MSGFEKVNEILGKIKKPLEPGDIWEALKNEGLSDKEAVELLREHQRTMRLNMEQEITNPE